MNTILIAVFLAIFYNLSNEAPLSFNLDSDGPSRNVSGSNRGINTLNESIISDSSATNKDDFDPSFQPIVDNDSSDNDSSDNDSSTLDTSNSNLYVINTKEKKSTDFNVEMNDAMIEEIQMNKIMEKIIFSLIRLASDQINSNKYIHYRNKTNKNVSSGIEGPTVIQLETVVQSQRVDHADLPAQATNTLLNDNTANIEHFQDLNNSTKDITPEVSNVAKRNETGLEKSNFSDIGGFESLKEVNGNRQEMTSLAHLKRARKMFEEFIGKNYIHENEDVKTQKMEPVLSGLKRLYKRSSLRRSKNGRKSRRRIVAEDIKNDNTIKNIGMPGFRKLISQIRSVKEPVEEISKVSDFLNNKDTFDREIDFVASKKKKDADWVYMSKLKNSANLNNGNRHRSLVKKDSDTDLPNIDPGEILYNVDRSELQAYGADIKPVKQNQCPFVKNSMKNQQGNVPAQLDIIHINHHVVSKTDCPLSEDYLNYPEDSKVYKIAGYDSPSIKPESDFMNLYDQPKNTHTSEELNDVFKQVELEVLGLDDDSQYQDDLLKNYSKSQIDDIFRKLYFEIFDIKENKKLDEPDRKDSADKDRDRIFKDLNFDKDDDNIEYQDIYDMMKGCKGMQKIACQKALDEMLSKDTEKLHDRNNFNSVDFSIIDKNGPMHGLGGIMGSDKPSKSNDMKNSELSVYITQECFENITQNNGLGLTDIQRARMNCKDSNLDNNTNDNNNNNDIDIDKKAKELYNKTRQESLKSSTESSKITVNEENRGKLEWNETDSDSDSANGESGVDEDLQLKHHKHPPKHDSGSDSSDGESSNGEDLELKKKHHPKNDSVSKSADGESSDGEDLQVKHHKHPPKNDTDSDSENGESSEGEDLHLKHHKHPPKNDSVSKSADGESSEGEDLHLKHHKHPPKNDSVSKSADKESGDGEDLHLKHHKHHPKNDSVSKSADKESGDGEDLHLKHHKHHHRNDSDSDSENGESSEGGDLHLKHHKHHPKNDIDSDFANDLKSKDKFSHKTPDDVLKRIMASERKERPHQARISISVKANIQDGSALNNLKFAKNHKKDEMMTHHSQHEDDSNESKEHHQNQISIETNCEITLGKRSSDRELCLKNHLLENRNLALNEIQQIDDDQGDMILIGDTNEGNVSKSLNPETIVVQVSNTTSKDEGINLTQIIT